jgi:hypothetical protein
MREVGPNKRGKRVYRNMTVALIRDQPGADTVEVAFSESARFYTLSRTHPDHARILRELREARENRSAVRVLVDDPEGDVIKDVQADG